jgi:hypothetical protein
MRGIPATLLWPSKTATGETALAGVRGKMEPVEVQLLPDERVAGEFRACRNLTYVWFATTVGLTDVSAFRPGIRAAICLILE